MSQKAIVFAAIAISLASIVPTPATGYVNDELTLIGRFHTSLENPLPALNIDKDLISVSGVSSGAAMAHQFQLIHSSRIIGAGIVAGVPYECAFSGTLPDAHPDVWKGTYVCTSFMRNFCAAIGTTAESGRLICRMTEFMPTTRMMVPSEYLGAPDFYAGPGNRAQDAAQAKNASLQMAKASAERVLYRSRNGQIDELTKDSNLFGSKVFLFTGGLDTMVPRGVVDATVLLYKKLYEEVLGGEWQERFEDNIEYVTDVPAAHAIVTNSYLKKTYKVVQECATFNLRGSFINNCSDLARSCAEKNCVDAIKLRSACPLPSNVLESCDQTDISACEDRCKKAVREGHSSNVGDVLRHIYGAVDAPNPSAQPTNIESAEWRNWVSNKLFAFGQTAYSREDTAETSLGHEGYIFIPERCDPANANSVLANGERVRCKLHVAFHGCAQGYDNRVQAGFEPKFPLFAGYNEWAAANDIVVLYPQVQAQGAVYGGVIAPDLNLPQHTNPGGCWELWGYTDENYATYEGRQVRAVAGMINALVGDQRFLRTSPRRSPND